MKKYWIKDLSTKQAILAPTREVAILLSERFQELGLEWCDGDSYLDAPCYEVWEVDMCYVPAKGQYAVKDWCERKGWEILTIEQLLDFENVVHFFNRSLMKPEISEESKSDEITKAKLIYAEGKEVIFDLDNTYIEGGMLIIKAK